jgi:hypothetical protein
LAISTCPDISESDIACILVYAINASKTKNKLFGDALGANCADDEMVKSLSQVDSTTVLGMLGWIERTLGDTVSPLDDWFLTSKASLIERVLRTN